MTKFSNVRYEGQLLDFTTYVVGYTSMLGELHYVHSCHTCVPYVGMDLRLFSNILVFKQVMINGIVDSSKML